MFPKYSRFLLSFNMDIKVKYLHVLVNELVKRHNVLYDRKGLREIGESIGISSEYIYKKIVNPISKMKPNESLGLRNSIVSALLEYLEFKNIQEFIHSVDRPISNQVKSMVGVYYTYVRRNTKEGVLLRSPVRIYEDAKQIYMTLKGEQQTYSGKVEMRKGVLSILLENNEGKCFHHLYKIGAIEKPKVLQGIFSGVTSGFDPIGGRVILERRDEGFEELKTAALDVTALKNSRVKNDGILAKYFSKYSENNLKIGKTSTFGFGDLE